ncbi:hypothetical protein [Lichenicoccus sp.]|uniref:hypothetical protein n=1 Tax=Lichenicoccus sp. TaxID=2781899 RepID=UPI003D09D4F9
MSDNSASEEVAPDTVTKGASSFQAAGDAARRLGEQAGQAGAQAAGHAKDFAHEAQSTGASLAGSLQGQAGSAAETGKNALADQLDDVAQAVHRSGAQLEGHQDWAAHLVERGAAELGTLASSLRRNDLHGLMNGLQDLAHRQPALFTGASLAAGFALARVGRVAVAGASKADLPKLPEVGLGQ